MSRSVNGFLEGTFYEKNNFGIRLVSYHSRDTVTHQLAYYTHKYIGSQESI